MNPSPRPLDGEIHLYCLTLPQETSELTRFEHLLSKNEADRAGRLKSAQTRNRFIAGRGMLRDILGGYLGIDPADVTLATGEHGKPFLADGAADLRFNLSHADEMMVLAVSTGVEVGVDIERIDPGKAIHDMARLAFSRQEQEELLALPASRQVEAFYRFWVCKEACLKACGRGFSLPGGSFSVPLLTAASTISTFNSHPSTECNWRVMDMDVPLNYCAALAFEIRSAALPLPKAVLIERHFPGSQEHLPGSAFGSIGVDTMVEVERSLAVFVEIAK
ncbi:MAG: 4'-phosphopantetheinyl transferase superfamily protein [Oryzomonas sp.]|uniref:4'-phosphopantetheinyl transferase family protein n=1 Tax=Oryzomonas sp. TaxID=2855186 RepID=UPI002851087E|nr:4'-phosphopantetheinyl transferase superfamily protein [Oryzomonas sp.]MDR3580451.1 4'-phosphopantetheinyl transferase superfamily protein [Oryzomonas sp.]